MATRFSLIVAMLATFGLIALGATSLDAAVARMGAKGWNRLHNTVYVCAALALLHYLLSPDIYPEQFLTTGMFFWLMVWRVLKRRGQGAEVAYHGYEPVGTLRANFSLVSASRRHGRCSRWDF
jgi:DMSO/TMAO reductase YedYZ heme-binding membrane subunit